MVESWKAVPGFIGKYQISTMGKVRRVFPSGKTRELHPYLNRKDELVIHLTDALGKTKEYHFLSLVAVTFLGPSPANCVPYHINGCKSENNIRNIAYISRKELGKRTGAASRRQPVAKLNKDGEVVDVYSSAREAARQNFMSYQTVMDYCNGKRKGAFAPDGFAYAWDDSAVSMKHAIRKIELSNGFMVPARHTDYDF